MRRGVQEEILQWLCQMEELAVSNQVKTRLLDVIQEYKKEMESDLTPAECVRKIHEIEELLEQLKKQMSYDLTEEKQTKEIRQKTDEIIERCKRSNEILKKDYIKGALTYIQETERSMEELCNVQANYNEVTNKEQFLNVMDIIGQKYRRQADELQAKYISRVLQNYQNTFDRLKGLFVSTGYGEEIQKKFYETYYENQDSLERDIQEYTRNLEKGENSIIEYAKKVQGTLQGTIKRIKRKASRKKWMPMIIILILLTLGITGKVMSEQNTVTEQKKEAATTEEPSNVHKILDITERIIAENLNKEKDAISNFIQLLATGGTLMLGFPVLIILFLLYWIWIRSVNRHCCNQIIKEAEKLQKAALDEWKRQQTLMAAIEERFGTIEAYADKSYQKFLSQLLNNPEKIESEKASFRKLCSDWDTIKGRVEF